jgi:hypothetical protein
MSVVSSLAPRAAAAATTSDWKLWAIRLQARIACDLAAAELAVTCFEAPVALPLIASAAKPRSAAAAPRRPLVIDMLDLLCWGDAENASDRERRLSLLGLIHPS